MHRGRNSLTGGRPRGYRGFRSMSGSREARGSARALSSTRWAGDGSSRWHSLTDLAVQQRACGLRASAGAPPKRAAIPYHGGVGRARGLTGAYSRSRNMASHWRGPSITTIPSRQSSSPHHPANTDPGPAEAVRVTRSPRMKLLLQSLGQEIPAGSLFTEPDPVPVRLRVSGTVELAAAPLPKTVRVLKVTVAPGWTVSRRAIDKVRLYTLSVRPSLLPSPATLLSSDVGAGLRQSRR